ncbi:AbrB/MazE/SpoVT family DNA-binding domain-containing protein [Candidatus Woesearchaeota archaeon]|nr:AbrB/MazE/SpoVT family DNA-binding domain-containing protein [Candidatus Woesearchaeota archaeon]
MDVAITKMSSKGQVVIPAEMREDIKEGEKLLIIKGDDKIIMKKAKKLDKQLEEDLEFARRTEKAWKAYARGEFISQDADEFLKDLEKWAKD